MNYPEFIGGSYEARSPNADAERTLNLYPEAIESRGAPMLQGTPGLHTFCTLGTTPHRGSWANNPSGLASTGRLFSVYGSKLYEVVSAGTFTDLGDVGDDSAHSPVQLFPNGSQLAIISAGKLWVHNGVSLVQVQYSTGTGTVNTAGTAVTWVSGDTFAAGDVGKTLKINGSYYVVSAYTDATHITIATSAGVQAGVAYSTAVTCSAACYVDGYLVFVKPNSREFGWTNLYDMTTVDALDFDSKDGYPDDLVSILGDHGEIVLFGDQSIEVWRNEGGTTTFSRDPGATIQQGCSATFSPVSIAGSIYWLGGDGRGAPVAWRAKGYYPARVSKHAQEKAWSLYSTIADAESWTYVEDGHHFWCLSFPTAGKLWVFDVLTEQWHERCYWTGSAEARHRSRGHAYVWGKHFTGDYANGKLYQQSLEFPDDAGDAIKRLRRAYDPSPSPRAPRSYSYFALDFEAGTAASGSLSAAPTLTLKTSDDAGKTWTSGRSISAGANAKYSFRAVWWRCGAAVRRLWEVSLVNAEAKIAWTGADREFTESK